MKPIPDCGEKSYRGSGKLTGKKSIITGGESAIGRAVAIAFLLVGRKVHVVEALSELLAGGGCDHGCRRAQRMLA